MKITEINAKEEQRIPTPVNVNNWEVNGVGSSIFLFKFYEIQAENKSRGRRSTCLG
jgi:hypothetical protein